MLLDKLNGDYWPKLNWALVATGFYILAVAIPAPIDFSLIGLCLFSLLAVGEKNKKNIQKEIKINLTVLFFLMWLLTSSIFSTAGIISFKFVLNIFPFLLLSTILSNINRREDYNLIFLFLTVLSLSSSSALLIVAALNPTGSPPGWLAKLGSPLYVVPNDLILLSIILPLTLTFIIENYKKRIAILAVISCVLSLAAIVIFQTRSALLIYLISASLCLFRSSFNLRIRLLISLVLLSAFVLIFIWITLFKGLDTGGVYLGEGRIRLWMSACLMFIEKPLLGFGPGTFGLFYEGFIDKISLPQSFLQDYRHTPWPHNLYLEILAETGLPGLLLFLLICWPIIKIKNSKTSIGYYANYRLAVHFSLYAFLIAGFIELTFSRLWVIMTLSILLTLGYIFKKDC